MEWKKKCRRAVLPVGFSSGTGSLGLVGGVIEDVPRFGGVNREDDRARGTGGRGRGALSIPAKRVLLLPTTNKTS